MLNNLPLVDNEGIKHLGNCYSVELDNLPLVSDATSLGVSEATPLGVGNKFWRRVQKT